ncbi:spore germination protein [Cohnella sp. CFH 77786]|uniref:spore germination protein n=1 Tax=Cohnella sp. CFH 77786 TaxID=2662265 RepID=UPI001C6110C2|nr:spore germination protein [Cohnella sp. CFH 77786]
MPFFINISVMKTNGVNSNANLDVGATVHNSHTANSKFIGENRSFGDFSPTLALMNNNVLDTDISDQDQIANPSAPITAQI